MPVPLPRCLQDRFSPSSSSWLLMLYQPCAASRSCVREGDSCAVLAWADLISHESRAQPSVRFQKAPSGSGGIRQRRQKKPAEECCCGRGRSCTGGVGGPVDDPPTAARALQGQTSGQASLPEDSSGSPRQFRLFPPKGVHYSSWVLRSWSQGRLNSFSPNFLHKVIGRAKWRLD